MKELDEDLQAALRKPERYFSYWRIKFPQGVKLDNAVLSDDGIEIAKAKVGVKYQWNGKQREAMFVSWNIATKNSGYRKPAEKEEEDPFA